MVMIMKKLILILISALLLLGLSKNAYAINLSENELYWLTQNIYWESRNQLTIGQLLVGITTINRMYDSRWPNTIEGVVKQPAQFSWFWDGKSDKAKEPKAWAKAVDVAKYVSLFYELFNDSYIKIYWFHTEDVDPVWNDNVDKYTQIQKHIFYTDD